MPEKRENMIQNDATKTENQTVETVPEKKHSIRQEKRINNRLDIRRINGASDGKIPYVIEGNDERKPPIISPDKINHLETLFAKGLSRRAACSVAGISYNTLNRYCKHNPAFTDRINDLQETIIGKAELNIASSIEEGNLDQSRWLLERKARHIYGNKADIAVSTTVSMGSIEETRDALKKSVAAFLGVEDSTQDGETRDNND